MLTLSDKVQLACTGLNVGLGMWWIAVWAWHRVKFARLETQGRKLREESGVLISRLAEMPPEDAARILSEVRRKLRDGYSVDYVRVDRREIQ